MTDSPPRIRPAPRRHHRQLRVGRRARRPPRLDPRGGGRAGRRRGGRQPAHRRRFGRHSRGRSAATYVPLPDNPGYGGAMNAGVASAAGLASSGSCRESGRRARRPDRSPTLRERGETDPSIGAVGPLDPRSATASVYPSARAVPSLRTGVGHALFGPSGPATRGPAPTARTPTTHPVARDAGWLSGSCQLVRRSAFDELGGFDERLLHVLRGRRSRLPARQGRLPQRLRAGRRRSSTPARHSTGRDSARDDRRPPRRAPGASSTSKYPGPAALAGARRAGRRAAGSIADPRAPHRATARHRRDSARRHATP